MADFNLNQSQQMKQAQSQKLSRMQLQTLSFLHMQSCDLREEITNIVDNNPILEIVYDKEGGGVEEYSSNSSASGVLASQNNLEAIEASADERKTLYETLIQQLNLIKDLSKEEKRLCEKLIANLDQDGFYGSMVAPSTLLNKNQSKELLDKCITLIQHFEPIGTCCKNWEESLYVQAVINKDASPLTLFILNGNYNIILSTDKQRRATIPIILKRIKKLKKEWNSKEFNTKEFPLSSEDITEEAIKETFNYLDSSSLNPHPGFNYNKSNIKDEYIDIVAKVVRVNEKIAEDNIEKGIIKGDDNCYFKVLYTNNEIPEIRLNPELIKYAKENKSQLDKKFIDKVQEAENVCAAIKYRESTIMLQVCAIVKKQIRYFLRGQKGLIPLTRGEIADMIQVHESTVSRLTSKKNPRYILIDDGKNIFNKKLCDFFSSGVTYNNGKTEKMVGRDAVKYYLEKILEDAKEKNIVLSDQAVTDELNKMGVKIARRTVNKYRSQLHIENSYIRNK